MVAHRNVKAPIEAEKKEKKHNNFTQIPNYLFEEETWVTKRDAKGTPTHYASESVRTVLNKLISKLATSHFRFLGDSERELARKIVVNQSTLHRALPVLQDLKMVKYAHLGGRFIIMVLMDHLWEENEAFYAKAQETHASPIDTALLSFFGVSPDAPGKGNDAPGNEDDASCITGDAAGDNVDADARSKQGGNTSNTFSNTFGRGEEEEGDPPAATSVFSDLVQEFDPELLQTVIHIAQSLRLPPSKELALLVQEFSKIFSPALLRCHAEETRRFVDNPQKNTWGLPMDVSRYHTTLQFRAKEAQDHGFASKEKPPITSDPKSIIDSLTASSSYSLLSIAQPRPSQRSAH